MGDRGSDAAGYTTPGECSGCDRPSPSGLSRASVCAGVPRGERTPAVPRGPAPARRAVEADGVENSGDGCEGAGDDRALECELSRLWRWDRISAALSLWLRAIELALVRVLRAGEEATDVAADGLEGMPRTGDDSPEGGADGL